MTTDPWGIDSGYEDTSHNWHATLPETRSGILAAMGVRDADAPPPRGEVVRVVEPGETTDFGVPGRLELEDGTVLPVDGPLPPDLPWGYHRFYPQGDHGMSWLIVAPRQCLVPERTWGWAAQLYASRSRESWGIGDLVDLRRLVRWSARLHAGFLLVNPLGAAPPTLPQVNSPYFPSSRRFLNPLSLRVEEVPGAQLLGAELERLARAGRAHSMRTGASTAMRSSV